MSRRSCIREGGQALVELVFACVLMLPLFLLIYQSARLAYARLELISLTREAAMIMIHESKKELSPELLSELAENTRLDPAELSSTVEAAVFPSSFAEVPVLGQMGNFASQFFLGSKLTLRYRLHFGGVLGRMAPEGIELSETVNFQSGAWKNLGMEELAKIIFGVE